jgi:hypothetical protein
MVLFVIRTGPSPQHDQLLHFRLRHIRMPSQSAGIT